MAVFRLSLEDRQVAVHREERAQDHVGEEAAHEEALLREAGTFNHFALDLADEERLG